MFKKLTLCGLLGALVLGFMTSGCSLKPGSDTAAKKPADNLGNGALVEKSIGGYVYGQPLYLNSGA